ncbi:hypothetical protein B0H13DRAFT_1903834 [Mycena leptocephala]|nr:hypothetical protein B0H13DRAFT_1903834 [Mycena leptocephala]
MDFDLRYPDGLRPVYLWSLRGDQHWCSVGSSPDFVPPDANEFVKSDNAYPNRRNARGLFFTRALLRRAEIGGSDDGDSPAFAGYFLDGAWQTHILFISRRLNDIIMDLMIKNDQYSHLPWTSQLGDLPEQLKEDKINQLSYYEHEAREMANDARRLILSQLGFISWYSSICPRWKEDLDGSELEFIEAFKLEDRPKRGYTFALWRDYHELNLPHLLDHSVPFHYCWTDEESSTGRFVRLNLGFLSEFETLAATQLVGPIDLRQLPHYLDWERDLNRYDVYFQDQVAGRVGGTIRGFKPDWEYLIVDLSHYGARPVENRLARRAYAEHFKGLVKYSPKGTTCTFFRQNPLGIDEPPSARVPRLDHLYSLDDFGKESTGYGKSELEYFFEPTHIIRELSKNGCAPRRGRTYNTYNGMREWAVGSAELEEEAARSRSRVSQRSRASTNRTGAHGSGPRGEPLSLQERMEGADLRRARSPMSPTHRSEGGTSTWESRWALSMAGRRRSSRSMSPVRRGEGSSRYPRRRSRTLSSERSTHSSETDSRHSFEEEYEGLAEEGEIAPTDENLPIPATIPSIPFDNPPGPLDAYRPRFQTRNEAIHAIESWSSGITELKPPVLWEDDGWWNHDWLSKAILVCEDYRTYIRMKTWAACCDAKDICDILNMAICYGAAFELYVRQTDARKVGMPTQVTSLLQSTLHATYAAGFTEIFLDFGAGGATCYGRYLSQILALLSRPHAVAFIAAGGILSFIAQLYNKELVCRFLEGPSVQVNQFSKGKSFWMNNGEDDELWTTDQVSEGEISILLGHIVTGNPATDTFLWPHPSWLENDSDHFHGA